MLTVGGRILTCAFVHLFSGASPSTCHVPDTMSGTRAAARADRQHPCPCGASSVGEILKESFTTKEEPHRHTHRKNA